MAKICKYNFLSHNLFHDQKNKLDRRENFEIKNKGYKECMLEFIVIHEIRLWRMTIMLFIRNIIKKKIHSLKHEIKYFHGIKNLVFNRVPNRSPWNFFKFIMTTFPFSTRFSILFFQLLDSNFIIATLNSTKSNNI